MICSMCAEEYNEGDRFCQFCGNQLKAKQKKQGFEPVAMVYGPRPVYDKVPDSPDEEDLIKIRKLLEKSRQRQQAENNTAEDPDHSDSSM